MFAAIRRLSKSAVGTIILVLFLIAILASFALADMANIGGSMRGASAGELARVGGERISERDVDSLMRRTLNQARQQNPEASYATIAGEFGPILDSLIDERALLAFAGDHGFAISERLIGAEIAQLPGTKGLDGKFSMQAYAAFLQQQQMTDAEVRQLLRVALSQRLILAPAAIEARVPVGIARPYAAMLLEQREGQLSVIPIEPFQAGLNPSAGDLQAFYAQNRQRYMVAEQRILKLAKIGPETVAGVVPSEAEIAKHYNDNRATYAGSETRVISQAVVQDKRQADGIAARARSGASFVAAAAPAGLSAEDVSVGPQTRAQFAGLAGDAVANAAFKAGKGAIVGPVRSDLGWHVIKIDDIRGATGRNLAQARGEIAALLTANKRKEALIDLVTRADDQIADGASFADVTAAAKLPVTTTPAINASGAARADAAYQFPAELQPALKAGFAMAVDDDPEIVTLPNDTGYVMVAVERVIEAAPAPLAEIRDRVRTDWIHRKASDRARAVASQIAAKVARGMPMDQAVSQEAMELPPVQTISARRIQIARADQNAVAPLRMMFSLAQGKSRMVADPQDRGYFVVKTNKVVPGNALTAPMLIGQTQREFQETFSNELSQQLLAAMKADQGVKRDEEAIERTRRRYSSAE